MNEWTNDKRPRSHNPGGGKNVGQSVKSVIMIKNSQQQDDDGDQYLCMPWKSVYHSLILSAHISGVIWYWSMTRCGSRSSVANISGWYVASS